MNERGFGIWSEYQESLNKEKCIITILKTPKGSAPWRFRKAWRGLELFATMITPNTPEFDPIKYKEVPARFGFVVKREDGLRELISNGKQKAWLYYEENWPEKVDFTFGSEEVKFRKPTEEELNGSGAIMRRNLDRNRNFIFKAAEDFENSIGGMSERGFETLEQMFSKARRKLP